MNRNLIKFNQILIHIFTSNVQRWLFGFKRQDIKFIKGGKYIMVGNHMTFLDSHMILAAIPFKEYLKLLPIRFITTHKFMDKWYWNFFLSLQGCVSTRPKNKEKLLKSLEKQLRKGDTIVIYPRGGLYKPRTIRPARVGAVYLEKKVKNSKIIPVKVSVSKWYNPNKMIWKMITKKTRVSIEFKDIFRHKNFPKDLSKLSEQMMKDIEK
jgi:1-acyl-sn-glycerol-3-phosphate acyltransferase